VRPGRPRHAASSLSQPPPGCPERKRGDARLVQIEGFDPEEVAMLETCLKKLGPKNGTPVIPSHRATLNPTATPEPPAVPENAVTTLTLAGNVCTWPDAADRLRRTERQLLNDDRPTRSEALRDRIWALGRTLDSDWKGFGV